MNQILEISNLHKKYEGFALKDVSFSLERGFVLGFIGPNGAGKTTTIKLIMNLIKRDSGTIKVFGLDNLRHEKEIKEKIGFVYDENYFYEELTTEEMKRIIAPFYTGWDEALYQKYIREFELPPRKRIKELSKGMKLKFSLALALSHQAELLVMDEPTSGLDPVFRNEFLDILRDYMAVENRGVIFSTHVTSDLEKIADYITMINKGEIVFSMSKEDLYEEYVLLKGPKSALNQELKKVLIGWRESSLGFQGLARKRWQGDVSFATGSSLGKDGELVLERPTLEDIMLYTIRGGKHV